MKKIYWILDMALRFRGILTFVIRMRSKRRSNVTHEETVEKQPRKQSSEDEEQQSSSTQNLDWCTKYPGSSRKLARPLSSKWNMKIVSWNVNGIRAVIKNKGIEYIVKENADIVCIQKTKCRLHEIPSKARFPSYQSFWSSADKAGYAGTALFSKISPIKVTYGIGIKKHDEEGRVITAEYDKFYLVTAYELFQSAGDAALKVYEGRLATKYYEQADLLEEYITSVQETTE
ncbi:unnamed protein product [Schistosoma turkestanicum]|nr:unnamed protein product [Schistosoma turkestanicum]